GGERNRLLLARLFTRPANVLVLDEPTNDLDLETLELLEEQLVEWPGTLLLVSHDRVFLDNVVTSTFAFEGNGRIGEYVGGYADWQRQARAAATPARDEPRAKQPAAPSPELPRSQTRRLSYKEQRELESLPAHIEALESEQRTLNETIAAPGFYKEAAETINNTLARLDALQHELTAAYTRWDELENRAIKN
ncbi:MAG: ABC transporter ATP-binding protein, partial [Acidobacteria bacterium]|nr:ABC transporter ATP-binding protein [Acidobacteriota bacterium]